MASQATVTDNGSLGLVAGSKRPSAMSTLGAILTGALILLGLAAFIPTNTNTLASRQQPASSYESALLLAKELQRSDSDATPEGKTVVRVHGQRTPRVVVFFHGLTNSPRQYRALADSVYNDGSNVIIPRLAWHGLAGGTASNLGKMTADDLTRIADLTVNAATGLGDTVIVFGVSLGGVLTSWVAQNRTVDRAVIASPALGLSHLSTTLQTPAMNVMLRAPNYSKKDPPDTLRPDRTLGWSTRGVGEMLKLGTAVRRGADDKAPLARDIRVISNLGDMTVNRSAIDELVDHWQQKGGAVHYYELADSLKLPHDIVDPDETTGRTNISDPIILALIRGGMPPAIQGVRVIPRVPERQ
jgi:esterase/lipase